MLARKIPLHQAIRRFTESHGIGRSQSLDARTNVGNLAKCQAFVPPFSTHFTDYNQPRMDPYAESELNTFLVFQTGTEVSHGSKNSQTSSYCSLCVIFMGDR